MTHWEIKGEGDEQRLGVWRKNQPRDAAPSRTFQIADRLNTLIGYRQSPELLGRLGLTIAADGTPARDFDGEFQRAPGAPGRKRLLAGYYGLGALIESQFDPNAVVIPGIMNRLRYQSPMMVSRAKEWAMRRADREAIGAFDPSRPFRRPTPQEVAARARPRVHHERPFGLTH